MELGITRDDNGRTPIERIAGDTPDAFEYTDFGFYDCVEEATYEMLRHTLLLLDNGDDESLDEVNRVIEDQGSAKADDWNAPSEAQSRR